MRSKHQVGGSIPSRVTLRQAQCKPIMINILYRHLINNQIVWAFVLVVIAVFLWEIKAILAALFIAFIITSSLHPVVNFLRQNRVPKILAVLISYISVLVILGLLIFPLLPFTISQIQSLIEVLPKLINNASLAFGFNIDASQVRSFIGSSAESWGGNAFSLTGRIFGNLFLTLTVFIVSLYLMIDFEKIEKSVATLFSKTHEEKVITTVRQIQVKLGAWLRGQIVLSLTIGVITYVALYFLGIPYALPLALLAGFLEIIPTLGPILSAIPAVIVALTISPAMALVIVGVYSGIQVAENNLLVPQIMKKAVGLNPVVIILAVLVGGSIMGVIGALLAIPFVSALLIIYKAIK